MALFFNGSSLRISPVLSPAFPWSTISELKSVLLKRLIFKSRKPMHRYQLHDHWIRGISMIFRTNYSFDNKKIVKPRKTISITNSFDGTAPIFSN